jgi:hypothetical protein
MIKFIRSLLMTTSVHDGEEKVKSAIAFLASEYERLTQNLLAVTTLHKLLAFLDSASLEKTGHPALGLPYRERGRTFTDPYERRETPRGDCFMLIPQKGEYVVKATGEPDLSCFSSFELNEMKRLVEVNADRLAKELHKRFSSLETDGTKGLDEVDAGIRDDTREEAWTGTKNAAVDVSERDFFTKPREVAEMTGLNLLIEKYETRLQDLEAQMTEVRRKLETVTETFRLLKEEGLSEDEPRPDWS